MGRIGAHLSGIERTLLNRLAEANAAATINSLRMATEKKKVNAPSDDPSAFVAPHQIEAEDLAVSQGIPVKTHQLPPARQLRGHCYPVARQVEVEPDYPADEVCRNRTRRKKLVRHACLEDREVVTRHDFRVPAQSIYVRVSSDLAQVLVCGVTPARRVLRHGHITGQERPDAAVVVANRIVERAPLG